ncbi:MAG: hypothetical protein LBR66_00680 [Candidatus Symbiothrix sp.]|nr:hypothetical protein [Candidatus Symbiothrix sp.]
MKRIKFLAIALISVATLFTACDTKEEDDGGKTGVSKQITFDKTEYYPFDAVVVQLPEAAAAETYNGSIGTNAIKAQRMDDSTLVVALPDLTAGEYTLSLQIGQSKAEGKLQIVALPVVANPEAVIDEIKTSFDGYVAALAQNAPAYAPVLTQMVGAFNEHVAKLSDAERQQFAAIWQAHPEWHDYALFDETNLRASALDRARWLSTYSVKFVVACGALIFCGDTFVKSVYALSVAPNLLAGAVAVASAVGAVASLCAAIDYADRAEKCAYDLKEIIINGKTYPALRSSSEGSYDYTLKNGETLTFNVQASYHSITAGSTTSVDGVSAIIESAVKLQSLWDKIAAGINTVRQYVSAVPQLTNRPKTVAELTSPLNVETDAADNWSVQIVSGDVSAQKQADNSYKFTTTATKDVAFTFKIMAEGVESEVLSGWLKVEEKSPIVGVWKFLYQVREWDWIEDDTHFSGEETFDIPMYYMFTSNGSILYSNSTSFDDPYYYSVAGSYSPFIDYGIRTDNTYYSYVGYYILESETSLIMVTELGSSTNAYNHKLTAYLTKVAE